MKALKLKNAFLVKGEQQVIESPDDPLTLYALICVLGTDDPKLSEAAAIARFTEYFSIEPLEFEVWDGFEVNAVILSADIDNFSPEQLGY